MRLQVHQVKRHRCRERKRDCIDVRLRQTMAYVCVNASIQCNMAMRWELLRECVRLINQMHHHLRNGLSPILSPWQHWSGGAFSSNYHNICIVIGFLVIFLRFWLTSPLALNAFEIIAVESSFFPCFFFYFYFFNSTTHASFSFKSIWCQSIAYCSIWNEIKN